MPRLSEAFMPRPSEAFMPRPSEAANAPDRNRISEFQHLPNFQLPHVHARHVTAAYAMAYAAKCSVTPLHGPVECAERLNNFVPCCLLAAFGGLLLAFPKYTTKQEMRAVEWLKLGAMRRQS